MPIVADPAEQRRLVRRWTKGSHVPKGLSDLAIHMRPADRIALLYPAGLTRGALWALRTLAAHDRLPRNLPHPAEEMVAAQAYAAGLARGVALPPKAVFTPKLTGSIMAIYSAGVEHGALLVLEQAK
jgi:hypothetical protein